MLFEEIRAIIAEQLGKNADTITETTRLSDDLNADSLDLFQIIVEIEDKYSIKIEKFEGLATVGDAVKYVESLLK